MEIEEITCGTSREKNPIKIPNNATIDIATAIYLFVLLENFVFFNSLFSARFLNGIKRKARIIPKINGSNAWKIDPIVPPRTSKFEIIK